MRFAIVVGWLVASASFARADTVDKLVDNEIAWLATTGGHSMTPEHPDSVDKDAIFAPNAEVIFHGNPSDAETVIQMTFGPSGDEVQKITVKDRQIVVARDGKSAWISFSAHLMIGQGKKVFPHDIRVSEVVANTATGWRVIGGIFSNPQPNAAVNRDAKAGKLTSATSEPPTGDQTLRDAFTALLDGPLDPEAVTRKDLVAFGSGPGERTVGGAGLAKAWVGGGGAGAWSKHFTANKVTASLAPSGTTGWVIASVELAKGTLKSSYKIPFQLCFVFDKTTKGTWSLVHAVFSIQP